MSGSKAPKWFGIVAIVALLWNLLGVMAYVMQVTMSPEALAALPEDQRLLQDMTPAWATGAFAVAVFGGALGSLALILKKSWAMPILMLSLMGVVVQMFHSLFMSNSFAVFGPGGMVMPVMVMAVALYLVFLATQAKNKGWIN